MGKESHPELAELKLPKLLELQKYEDVHNGFTKAILEIATKKIEVEKFRCENESDLIRYRSRKIDATQDIVRGAQRADTIGHVLGRITGAIVVLAAMAMGYSLILQDKKIEGLVTLVTAVSAVVIALVVGYKMRKFRGHVDGFDDIEGDLFD